MGNNNLGASQTKDNSNRVYLNLRTGKLSETAKEPREGFKEFVSQNASGQTYKFFARTYDDLCAYIKDVQWHEFEWEGKKIVGWNVTFDTRDGKEFVLQVNSGDRPYQTLMQLLPSVDFAKPVRVVAFMGKDQKSGKNQKVLLLTHNLDRTAKEWIQPTVKPKWLSTLLMDKIKQKLELTEQEQSNLVYLPDGTIFRDFPYIKQKKDGTWSFDAWTDFLIDNINNHVIPAVREAAAIRGEPDTQYIEAVETDDAEFDPFDPVEGNNDDVPF